MLYYHGFFLKSIQKCTIYKIKGNFFNSLRKVISRTAGYYFDIQDF